VLGAAMIRAVLRPKDDRLGYLRLSADELRQLGLGVLTVVVFVAVYMAALVAAGLAAGLIAAVTGGSSTALVFAMVAVVLVLMTTMAVRLSLAPALTFDTGHINLFGSWPMTRGRFWPLLGTYALALGLVLVVYLLSFLVIFAISAILNGGDLANAMARPDTSSFRAYFTPWRLAETGLTAIVSALVWPVLFTPPTSVYRRLTPGGASAADAFN